MAEIVLYGGKGGVGKTTMAAASGVDLAREGHATLVVSTDPAHSLADAVGTSVGGDPTPLRENLWAAEVDPQAGIDRYQSLFELLVSDLADAGLRLDEEEVASLFTSGVMPGSDELAALEGLATYLGADRWDRIVFDTAPTGQPAVSVRQRFGVAWPVRRRLRTVDTPTDRSQADSTAAWTSS
jgi:arsenite-transporting ATPase